MSPPPTAPARVLYIVARDRQDLYAALRNAFVESPRLGIVLDRRDPPPATATWPVERRTLVVDEALRTQGWACVRVEPDGRVTVVDEGSVTGKESDGGRSDR